MTDRDPLYRRHRFPADIIAHAVWLYFRFPLSLRMVEDLLAARRIIVSHQTVRLWAEKFGRTFANEIRRQSSGRLGNKWHLDEAVVSICGKKHWLWRAVDQDGFVLDVLAQSGSDTYVYGDVSDNKKSDFAIRIDTLVSLDKGDFIL